MNKRKRRPSNQDKLRATEQQLRAANQQLRASEQQLKAANQQLRATNQQLKATEEELCQVNNELRDRVKKLDCIYGLSQLAEQRDKPLQDLIKALVGLIPAAWSYPEITGARITFETRQFKTDNFRRSVWIQSADINVGGQKAGTIEVCYRRKKAPVYEGPFSKPERSLLNALAERLGKIAERRQAEQAVIEARQFAESIVETVREPLVVLDKNLRVVSANHSFYKTFKVSPKQTEGRLFYELGNRQWDIPELRELIERILPRKSTIESFEVERDFEGIGRKTVLLNACELRREKGKERLVLLAIQDITERKRAEEALKESEKRLRLVVSNAPVVLFALDRDSVFTLSEGKGLDALGLKPGEVVGRSIFEVYGDVPQIIENIRHALAGETFTSIVEVGDLVFETRYSPLKDKTGKVVGVLGIAADITERKQAEKKLLDYQEKLKSLASQLTLVEERERRRIATDLHARISQSLVISKMRLEGFRKTGYGKELDDALEEICNLLGQTIQETRTLIYDLSSPLLTELGFEKAVAEWLTIQIQERHRIETEFKDDGLPKPLDEDIRVILFRSVRELLTNVIKHAEAKKVKVSIRKVGEQIQVTVEDDGWGFDPAEVAAKAVRSGAFGLFSIRERLGQLGGGLNITSERGRGTQVTMQAPLRCGKNNYED